MALDHHHTDITTDVHAETGRAGRLWRCTLTPNPEHPAHAATLAMWLLQVPGASPAWDCFSLSIIYLRDIPDVPPARKDFAEATHEIIIAAIDPKTTPDPKRPEDFRTLRPINFAGQCQLDTDEKAVALALMMARGFADGMFPIEPQGFRFGVMSAVEYIQATLTNTAAHLRDGFCPESLVQAPDMEN